MKIGSKITFREQNSSHYIITNSTYSVSCSVNGSITNIYQTKDKLYTLIEYDHKTYSNTAINIYKDYYCIQSIYHACIKIENSIYFIQNKQDNIKQELTTDFFKNLSLKKADSPISPGNIVNHIPIPTQISNDSSDDEDDYFDCDFDTLDQFSPGDLKNKVLQLSKNKQVVKILSFDEDIQSVYSKENHLFVLGKLNLYIYQFSLKEDNNSWTCTLEPELPKIDLSNFKISQSNEILEINLQSVKNPQITDFDINNKNKKILTIQDDNKKVYYINIDKDIKETNKLKKNISSDIQPTEQTFTKSNSKNSNFTSNTPKTPIEKKITAEPKDKGSQEERSWFSRFKNSFLYGAVKVVAPCIGFFVAVFLLLKYIDKNKPWGIHSDLFLKFMDRLRPLVR